MTVKVEVRTEDFSAEKESEAVKAASPGAGALVSFIGIVRGAGIRSMELEHYPAMTENAVRGIVHDARSRWSAVESVTVIHRVGKLLPGDNIVLVIVSAAHRREAFEAAEFIMDWLKTEAPFWKKETLTDGTARWVDARESDDAARDRWKK